MGVLRRIFTLERLPWNLFVVIICYWLLAFGLSVFELSAENWNAWWNSEFFREPAWREGERIYSGRLMRYSYRWIESEENFEAVFCVALVVTSFIKGVKACILGWVIRMLIRRPLASWKSFRALPTAEKKDFLWSFEWLPVGLLFGVSLYWSLAFMSVFNGGRKWLDMALFTGPGELLSRGVFAAYCAAQPGKNVVFLANDSDYFILLLCLAWLFGCVAYFLGLRVVTVLKARNG